MLQPVYEYEDQVSSLTLKANNSSLQASVVPIIQQHLRETASPGNHGGPQQPDCDGASDNSNESFDENMSEQGLMRCNI